MSNAGYKIEQNRKSYISHARGELIGWAFAIFGVLLAIWGWQGDDFIGFMIGFGECAIGVYVISESTAGKAIAAKNLAILETAIPDAFEWIPVPIVVALIGGAPPSRPPSLAGKAPVAESPMAGT